MFTVLLTFSSSLATKYVPVYNESCMDKTKEKNVKVFNMIARIYVGKKLLKHISYDCKYKVNSTTCNSNQKWNNVKCQCKCTRKYCTCTKDYSWNPNTCICKNGRYLKSIADTSIIMCGEITNASEYYFNKLQ